MCSDFLVFLARKKSLDRQKPTIVPQQQHVICLGPDQKKIMIRNNDVFRLFMCFQLQKLLFLVKFVFQNSIDNYRYIYKSKKTDVL